jgi:hypothetical protein
MHKFLLAVPVILVAMVYALVTALPIEAFEVIGIGIVTVGGPALISRNHRLQQERTILNRVQKTTRETLREWTSQLLPEDRAKGFIKSDHYEQLMQNAFSRLIKPGHLMFNPPSRMRLGKTERVEVRVARSVNLTQEILKDLRGQGTPQVEATQTAPFMAVTLMGGAFDISAYSLEEQRVIDGQITTWEYDITANKRGQQRLAVCISLRIPLTDEPWDRVSIPVHEAIIDVEVSATASISRFATANWQWVIGTAIAIAAVVVVAR